MKALTASVTAAALAATVMAVQAQQGATFRSNVNMLAVNALVVDRDGTPILGLLPEDFNVSVNGQPRRVVSATLVKYTEDTKPGVAGSITPPISLAALRTPGQVPDDGRVIVIAVDEPSFLTSDMKPAVQGAQKFVSNLRPKDVVGLYLFPFARPALDLTHDHGAVKTALDRAIGRRETEGGLFDLTTEEMVEINAGNTQVIDDVFKRECPKPLNQPADESCPFAIRAEASSFASYYESEVSQRVYALGSLVSSLGSVPGHKTLVLLSGGMLSTARVGARPNVRPFLERIGEQAARANVMVYVVHMDNSFASMMSASRRGTRQPAQQSVQRFSDSGLYATGLEMLAVGRVLRETMSHYLLGVEPTNNDWDGRKLMVKVKTTAKGATVRAVREIIAK
jgi:VWFA-related protein